MSSPAPLLAMFFALSLGAAAMWWKVLQVLEALAKYGRESRVILSAGRADAMLPLLIGAVAAIIILVVALVRRHRPQADLVTLILSALLPGDVVLALLDRPVPEVARLGLILAITTAVASLIWLIALRRGLTAVPRIPFAAATILVVMTVIGAATVHCYHVLREIAMGG
ncbi:MAG TPA: hypothetical protein VNI54_11025 [Thermoanaerobaculia bacterium]|nr:hypothetical protein [Thermoanaerobaculia bacterium]